MTREQVELFEKAIAPIAADWDSMELRAIAERGRLGEWVLHCLRVTLGPDPLAKPTRTDLPAIEDLLVVHERRSIDDLHGLLESLTKGELGLAEEVIDLTRPNTSPPEPSFYIRKRNRQDTMSQFGLDSASVVLAGGEPTTSRLLYEEFRTVDASLRATDPPWDGLADLKRSFIGIGETKPFGPTTVASRSLHPSE